MGWMPRRPDGTRRRLCSCRHERGERREEGKEKDNNASTRWLSCVSDPSDRSGCGYNAISGEYHVRRLHAGGIPKGTSHFSTENIPDTFYTWGQQPDRTMKSSMMALCTPGCAARRRPMANTSPRRTWLCLRRGYTWVPVGPDGTVSEGLNTYSDLPGEGRGGGSRVKRWRQGAEVGVESS